MRVTRRAYPSIRSLGGFCHVKIHMVKKGDTLYELSKKYGISLENLIAANPQLADPNKLNIGDKVKIPSDTVSVPMPENVIHKHVVKQGDSLWQISKAWGVTLREMIDANPQLKNPNALLVGEIVYIPKVGVQQTNGEMIAGSNIPNKTTPGGETNTGPKVDNAPKVDETPKKEISPTETATPVIPQLPQLPEKEPVTITPNPAPNTPIQQSPVPVQMPMVANPSLDIQEEKVEVTQHLFIQYSVPAQEAMGNAPMMKEKSGKADSYQQGSDQMYPGISEGYSWNQQQYEQPNWNQPQYEQSSWNQQAYGQQPNWAQAQYMQPYYTEMPQMVQQGLDYCNPNLSQWGGDGSGYGGYGQGYSPLSNNAAPLGKTSVTCSNIYSCTPPYEWTYPEGMLQSPIGLNSVHPNTAFGGNQSSYLQPEQQGQQQSCGCHSRESGVGVIDQDITQVKLEDTTEEVILSNNVSNSNSESEDLANGDDLKKVETSAVNKGKSKSTKEIKPKARQQKRRRNPWIKN